MVTILKTETYGYGSQHILKNLWSLYLSNLTWNLALLNLATQTLHKKYGFDGATYQRAGPSSFR